MTVARGDLTAFLRRTDASRAVASRNRVAVPATLTERIAGDVRGPLWAGAASVVLVLLIACANVGNLLLSRGSMRQRFGIAQALLGDPRPSGRSTPTPRFLAGEQAQRVAREDSSRAFGGGHNSELGESYAVSGSSSGGMITILPSRIAAADTPSAR